MDGSAEQPATTPPTDNRPAPSPLWVFGYGSLVWNPGFDVAEQVIATLPGYHRDFCMRSIHHRGTEAEPGLVLALDAARGYQCHGVALRVMPGAEQQALEGLRERELISAAYLEKWLDLDLSDGRTVPCVTYVIDRHHRQYCRLDREEQAQIIARAHGGRGPNAEYLHNTVAHLTQLGIGDADLQWLSDRVRAIRGAVR